MPDNIEIIIGTYEQFLLGYKVESTNNGYKLTRSFATHSHQASVRDVASNKHYLASAGADDSIYLYNMKNRIESGKLTHHNDTVNSIAFTPDSSHILTCSTDGSIAAVRCGNWKLEKHWKSAHKGSPVNCLCIHPSGKLALSLGGDGVLRTWNLVKGRQAYATNLVPKLGLEAKNITVTRWSPDGTKYLIGTNFKVVLYSVENAGIIDEFQFEPRVTCVEFINDEVIIIGHDNGRVVFYDLDNSSEIFSKDVHDTRVKAIACLDDFIATASSSGDLKLWRFTTDSLDLLASEHCGARITCLVLAERFASTEIKKEEEILINENDISNKKKTVFKIRQEVIIEDEDDDEIEKKAARKSSKKLKLKQILKSKSTSSAEIEVESNITNKNVGKKSKPIEKSVSPKERKKKRKELVTLVNRRQKLVGLESRENNEVNLPEIVIAPKGKDMESKKMKKKRKVREEEEEQREGAENPDDTIELASSPVLKKRKSLTPLKSSTKIMKRKGKKLKKIVMKQ